MICLIGYYTGINKAQSSNTHQLFVHYIIMGKQSTVPQENQRKRGRIVLIQMMVYNGCTQNIPQHPHCLYITLPWGDKALFHKQLTLHQALRETDTLMLTILASIKHNLRRKKGQMVPIQMMVYNSCIQNIHQRPHCVYITVPWGNKALHLRQ